MVERLVSEGRPAFQLDGDELREGLCCDLGFDAESRTENIRRTAQVARVLAEAGTVALVALVSPYRSARAQARELHESAGLPFFEVWVATPLSECERRDPKGLYRRADLGEVERMTGIDDRYEPPRGPELVITPELGLPRATELVLELLEPTSCRPGEPST